VGSKKEVLSLYEDYNLAMVMSGMSVFALAIALLTISM
jgi:hypothetical protein